MVRGVRHSRDIAPKEGLHPIQSLDFEQVQVQVQVTRLTADGIKGYLDAESERIRGLLTIRDSEVPRRAVVILDGSNELVPTADVRRLQAEWARENLHLLRTVVHAMGVVMSSPLARGAFTAVTWLMGERMPWPVVAHPDLPTALHWAIAEVEGMGGTVSAELLEGGVSEVERRRQQLHARLGVRGA